MTKSQAWHRVESGSKVVVVAGGMPFSHRVTSADFDKYNKLLRRDEFRSGWQLEIFRTERDYCGMSDTPQARAKFIAKTLADKQVKIMSDAGGNGSDEVIEYLKEYQRKGLLKMRPDVVMLGMSDGDQLLNYLGGIGAVSPVQSLPIEALITDKTKSAVMREFLFKQKIKDVDLKPFNSAAQDLKGIEGKLVIFNGHSRRASYSTVINKDYGSILLLEATQQASTSRGTVSEGLQFALDSMASQGQSPKAILLSQSDLLHSPEQIKQIRKIAEKSKIPIFSGAPFGHAKDIDFAPLPLHTDVKIKVSGENATLSMSSVIRTSDDIEQVRDIVKSRDLYSVMPAPIAKEAVSIEHITVTCVYKKDGEGRKTPATHSSVILKEDKRSWANIVKGVKEVTDPKQFLFAGATRICRRYEATDLDCVNLTGRNVMIGFDGAPSFKEWQNQEGKISPSATQRYYNKLWLSRLVPDAQTVLMELLKTEQLQKASSLTFLSRGEIPQGFNEWLGDFAKGHDLKPSLFIGPAPKNATLFPDGPLTARGMVGLVKARLKVVEMGDESVAAR